MGKERTTHDIGEQVVIAYPGTKHLEGKLQIFRIPRKGEPLDHGFHVEGSENLRELRRAINKALGEGNSDSDNKRV